MSDKQTYSVGLNVDVNDIQATNEYEAADIAQCEIESLLSHGHAPFNRADVTLERVEPCISLREAMAVAAHVTTAASSGDLNALADYSEEYLEQVAMIIEGERHRT